MSSLGNHLESIPWQVQLPKKRMRPEPIIGNIVRVQCGLAKTILVFRITSYCRYFERDEL